jgi:3'(2'), 5'-bisphosphate nucleotidase
MTEAPAQDEILTVLEGLALAAGRKVMEAFHAGFAVERKADASPVTVADRASEAIILAGLRSAFPQIPCVAEEEFSGGVLPAELGEVFFLVDPLDGTKEFVARNDEFCVNIALVEDRFPVLGVIHAPVTGVTWSAAEGRVARDGTPIEARPAPERLVVIHSRSHVNSQKLAAFLEGTLVAERRIAGSAAKFCFVAQGEADLYPRLGPTSEWDTAAGQAILEAAGGSVRDLDGCRLSYGKPLFLNSSFAARGKSA